MSACTYLKDVWFAWYAQEPRLWNSRDVAEKRKKSDSKILEAFMKLFISDGFRLDESSDTYRDDPMALGVEAVLGFLRERGVDVRGANAILKHLCVQHQLGQLNDKIQRYGVPCHDGRITDPLPA